VVTARNRLSETAAGGPRKATLTTFRTPLPRRQSRHARGRVSAAPIVLVRRLVTATVAGLFVLGLGFATPGDGSAASPSPSPIAASPTVAPPGPTCTESLTDLVSAAAPGSVIHLDPCIYRESVEIDKPLTLIGVPGSEIRGSDVWKDWNARSGGTFESDETLPQSGGGGTCRPASDRCHVADQVFLDGRALAFVTGSPDRGEFSVSDADTVVLGDDPAGHVVEVSVRERWLDVSAPDVTIQDVTFRDAANDPQAEQAALRVKDADRFSLLGSHLFAAHGALLGIDGGTGHRVLDSELAGAGQEGFGITRVTDSTVARTVIRDNNTDGFDPLWEAGGGKATRVRGLSFDRNVVTDNRGPGLWCDIDCRDVSFTGNRTSGNEQAGIFYEISTAGQIRDNVVVENGWGRADWGWGAGILVSSSGDVEVDDNVVAWNADGISVISQERSDRPDDAGTQIDVRDNVIALAPQPSDTEDVFLLAWLQDGSGPLYDPSSKNHGSGNRFWSSRAEPAGEQFHWSDDISSLAAFSATPGGADGSYLSRDQLDEILTGQDAPVQAQPHVVPPAPPHWRALLGPLVVATIAGLALIVAIVIVVWRRRRPGGVEPPVA
jgi:hypothetical protein